MINLRFKIYIMSNILKYENFFFISCYVSKWNKDYLIRGFYIQWIILYWKLTSVFNFLNDKFKT
jgi:hypothetical protein